MADLAIAIKIATEDQSSGPISKIKSALGGLGDAVSAPGKAIGGLVSGFGQLGLAAAGVGAAIEGIKGVGNAFGLGALNEMEQTRASFQAFTKDAGMTEKILEDVRKEAALTPFAFGEMAKATASLLPVAKSSGEGLMDLVKQAEILAASNPLQGLEGASFALREAMTGDFTSIIERFNLSRQTINKLKDEGVPNMEIIRRAMAEMGFDADLISAKAETLDGRWSTFQDTLQTLQMKMGEPIFDAMKEALIGLQGILDGNMGTFEAWAEGVAAAFTDIINVSKDLFDIFMGGDSFDAAAEVLDKLFPPDVVDGILQAVDSLGIAFDGLFRGDLTSLIEGAQGVLEGFGAIIVGFVEDWASSFAAWIDGAESGMMDGLGGLLTGLMSWLQESGFKIIEKLAEWGAAFIDWVGPKIPPLLEALGGLLAEVLAWMLTTGLPALLVKLGEWGDAFVDWVLPRIPPLLLALGELLLKLGVWMATTALPAIIAKLAEWADAFVKWVPGAIVNLLFELGKLEVAFLKWIADSALSIAKAALDLGTSFVKGIQDGIAGALGGFWSWLQTSFVDRIPAFVRELLNINSPSGVFMDIGRQIVEGLRIGMQERLPSVEDVVSRLVGSIATTGQVTDWLRAAMHIAGVGSDWLPGLQRLVSWESSGNPRAVNSTSVGGQHATGLLQTLPSTFRGYAMPGMGDIFNPIHNAVAAIRYILATYGSVYEIPGIRDGDHSKFPGYATGGIAWAPQLARVAEREPELIVPISRLRPGTASGGIDRTDLDYLAGRIAASRPVILQGTSEELLRQVRRELAREARMAPRMRG